MATSDIAKSIQTDINHYVTRDRINNASFRKKLDPISKNILRRQNPLQLVFKDISTYDAENPIVESLLKETDIKKSSLIVILLDLCRAILVKGWKFKKRLDRLKGKSNNFNNDNNNVGSGGNAGGTNNNLDLYGVN